MNTVSVCWFVLFEMFRCTVGHLLSSADVVQGGESAPKQLLLFSILQMRVELEAANMKTDCDCPLLCCRVLISLLVLNLLHVLDLVPLKPYSRSLGERVLVPAICNSIHAVLAMWAKASSPYVSLFAFTLPLLPLLTVGFSVTLKLASPPPVHISVLISIMSGTSIVLSASKDLTGIEPLEYIYAPLALILHSLSLTWLGKVSEAESHHTADTKASIFDIYYTQLVNQSWVLGLLWLLHPDSPWQVLSQGSWQSLLFHGYLLALLLLGVALNFLVGGRSCQPILAAQGLQQVCDQVEVHIKRLDLFLCVLCLSLLWETACGGGMRGATGHTKEILELARQASGWVESNARACPKPFGKIICCFNQKKLPIVILNSAHTNMK
ncbi:hypothetical protein INR49_013300 [Caranx melampygus]|nr:hypothetical protein INR49_013300 [Caranx melampygus]